MLQLLRKIAFPFSLIYALVVHLRNYLYDTGFFKSISYRTPTICIGNLSVGGTGKTPMIEYLVRLLEGYEVAVLSRGYKRKSKGFLLGGPESTVEGLGDEPFQLYKKFPQLVVAVDADRRNGIDQLEQLVGPEVILLDDAFQHRRVKPKYSILLTTYSNLYIDDRYLPTGNLRDSKKEARRADLIIVTKCPSNLDEKERSRIAQRINPEKHQTVLFGSLVYGKEFKGENGLTIDLLKLKEKKLALVTGIASPGPLVSHLTQLGLKFQHLTYGDHHNFSDEEIKQFDNYDLVLTTEKDYVRLQGRAGQLYYLEVAHSFSEHDRDMLLNRIKDQI